MSGKFDNLRKSYRDSLKSSDTEEWFDLVFYRRIGYVWAVIAEKLGISPNAITIASIFLGVGAAFAFYFNSFWWSCLGAFLLVWADSFDSADGQLARMTGRYSRLGRILDGLSGNIWFASIYIALCLREVHFSAFFGEHPWAIWILAAVTGVCHAVQAAMADYYRQFHLYFLKGEKGSELEKASNLWDKFHALSWRKNFWNKLVLGCYTNYTVGQEKRTPWMQRLRRKLAEEYPDGVPAEVRERFLRGSRPLMKFTNILSFNTRTFALFAALLIFRQPWLYFLFELTILNIILLYMMARHEKLCQSLQSPQKK